MKRQSSGVTLIELMVAIAILALLVLAALPYTLSWVYSANSAAAKAVLVQAYMRAKAIGLRNPQAVTTGTASSLLVDSSNHAILVCAGEASDCSSSSSTLAWSGTYPEGVTIRYTDSSGTSATLTTLAFSSRGIPTPIPSQFTTARKDQSDVFTIR